ncbi:probable replication licensing factor MCM4 [Fusarium fujikuroi IMI 58289]|uniref:DNA replication licensing factor MCM4 n=1 Tax=Gibberella fujikuroi (strain CBS 195.34 / IMI 58289 / NRRL A-6831) TaxID=1279085 RepID=S0DIU6_GIBF5|nr:probable replication licensing factor MCM4 [Fusarium fujikuroi IMI 58289]KLO96236.1 putative replication licensing factor MCM4 [Fusarium fujikuroi]KLP03912.1 putative replication licensing factor MCM4 [Fusarium fujikuroi]CCT62429.1 probable replication licensing factor MCM4 [Fusarium fujikuroi IMI 58289]SCN74930.1 probable replication licensing factor MCM4 [Fusarium fujikuroi]SCO28787.1 probable replication licensing factor MCM4 [Fusarium fujikuroi]
MSSPTKRSTRSSATPRRAAGSSETPRRGNSQLDAPSSPFPYESSSPGPMNQNNLPGEVSSPLGHMTNSQSDAHTQSDLDPQRTPRANPTTPAHHGGSSPIRYDPSSSPGRSLRQQSELRSESSGLFLGSQLGTPAPHRRGDINSDATRTPRASRRVILDDAGRVVREGPADGSDAASFANRDPNTSEADVLGGQGQSLIWGTTVSIDDTFASFKEFLRNFTQKYRMYRDGASDEDVQNAPDAESKPYWEALENMLLLGTTRLYLDISDLNLYPPTRKLWHQIQAYPQEIVPVMDQSVHDMMVEIARAETLRNRQSQSSAGHQASQQSTQSSEPVFPSSDRPEEAPTPRTQPDQQQQASLEDQVASSIYVVRPFGLDKTTNLRDLNPSDMDRLISIKGLVIRTTPVIPDMKDAFFRCNVCNHSVNVGLDRGKIREPTECPREICKSKNSMLIVHNRCSFEDKQVIKLQETPDAVPAGQTPHSVSVCVYNELVDFCKAGDRVELTGIFRVSSVRVNPRQRALKSVHKTYVDVLHIQKVDKKRMGADPSTLGVAGEEEAEAGENGIEETRKITIEDEEKIRETAARDDIYELLARSLAPSIYEMDDVKKGILLQLFGGTNKTFQKGGSPKYRGDINVLLCGDPSTAKSQMLSYVHKIAPRGVYTSGKGSSAVGLTAYVTRDPETRQLVLESGALVLSDGGVCCIDEFDKMSDATRSVLHEVMEQQTVSVAKAGIITTLNARTSILASANPIGSRYNPDLPVPQNIDLPPTLLSRFDLVYLILDNADEKNDRRLAKHLLSLYLEDKPQSAPNNNDILPVEFLTLYISYARSKIQPTISQEAAQELVDCYVAMRSLGQDVRAADKRITATTRQLESMIRLSEAHAKMRLSETVTRDDVVEANRLIQSALKTAATDAQGRIDMSLLTEGTSAADRKRRDELRTALLRLLDDMTAGGNTVRWGDVARRLSEGASIPVEQSEFNEVMRALEAESAIMITGEGARRTIRRVTSVA